MIDINQFTTGIHNIVAQIPFGKVATYGQIAWLTGWPNHSRLVGRIMSQIPSSSALPCHRVVNSLGKLASGFPEQRERLLAENVVFRPNGNVDLKICQWQYMSENP